MLSSISDEDISMCCFQEISDRRQVGHVSGLLFVRENEGEPHAANKRAG